MLKDALKIEFPSLIDHLKKVVKRSKEIVSENSEISEVQARKLASEELKNSKK